MQPSDLELYTTRDLIDELLRRQTFLGVIVYSAEDFKGTHWSREKVFRVHFNANLDAGQACRLLDSVAGRLDQQHPD
jgi:hypothetical protein